MSELQEAVKRDIERMTEEERTRLAKAGCQILDLEFEGEE